MARYVLYLLVIAVAGCAASSTASLAKPEPPSICEITREPAGYIGKTIILHATYLKDGTHFELFMDDSCPRRIINVGYVVPGRDVSVDSFYQSDSPTCKSTFVCPAKADVIAAGILKKDEDGLYLNLTKILQFKVIE
jgi:hypothetical protein